MFQWVKEKTRVDQRKYFSQLMELLAPYTSFIQEEGLVHCAVAPPQNQLEPNLLLVFVFCSLEGEHLKNTSLIVYGH